MSIEMLHNIITTCLLSFMPIIKPIIEKKVNNKDQNKIEE
jgi:hypothetical protein